MSVLPEQFNVQFIINSDVVADIPGARPTNSMLAGLDSSFSELKPNTLIKIKASFLTDSNKEKKRKGRPPKQKKIEDSPMEELIDELNEVELLDLDDDDLQNDLELDDLPDEEDANNATSFSSEKGEKKLTKRQLYAMKGQSSLDNLNLEPEPLLSLPDKYEKRGRNKKNIIQTEEEIQRRNVKDQERKLKLQQQIEEHKQQTVDRILNEVGRKHKLVLPRQEIEKEEVKGKKMHRYKELSKEEIIIKYKSTAQGNTISFPQILNQYFQSQTSKKMPEEKNVQCSNVPCANKFKYRIPKTNLLACGLDCYKKLTALD